MNSTSYGTNIILNGQEIYIPVDIAYEMECEIDAVQSEGMLALGPEYQGS